MADLKARATTLQGWWNCTTSVYVTPSERKPGDNAYLRERAPEEYPEAQRTYWRATIREIDAMSSELAALRAHCVTEHNLTDLP